MLATYALFARPYRFLVRSLFYYKDAITKNWLLRLFCGKRRITTQIVFIDIQKGGSILLLSKELAASVVIGSKTGKPKLLDYNKSLTLIGKGRSAYVFRIQNTNRAMKSLLSGAYPDCSRRSCHL